MYEADRTACVPGHGCPSPSLSAKVQRRMRHMRVVSALYCHRTFHAFNLAAFSRRAVA